MKVLKTVLPAAIVILSVYAASSRSQIVYEVDPIVVTADKISQRARDALSSLTVITRKEIDAIHAEDLGEVLRLVPGLQVQQYGSYGNLTQLRLRGSEASHLLVMVDGIEVNDPFYGGFDIAHVSADEIERVEVVRGTQTSLYGADAIGGVVNVILRNSRRRERFRVTGEAGGNGLRRVAAGTSGNGSAVNYSLNVSHISSDGLNPRDAYKNSSASAAANMQVADNATLSMGLLFTDYYKSLPLSYYFDMSDYNYHQYIDPNNSQEGELVNGYAKIKQFWKKRLKTEIRGGVSINRLRNYNGSDIDPNFSDTSLNTDKLDVLVDEQIVLKEGTFLILSWQHQSERASRLDNSFYSSFTSVDKSVNTNAVSAALHSRIHGRLKLLLGVRNDNPSLFASRISPQVKVAYTVRSVGTRVRAGWSSGFRVPTLGDLYFPNYGNPDLKPEIAQNAEAGLDQPLAFLSGFRLENAAITAVAFQLDVSDMIAYNDKTWKTENIAEAHYSGIELEYSSLLGSRGFLRCNYTFQKARSAKFEIEEPLARRPRNSFNLFAAFIPVSNLELSAEYSSIGEQLAALTFITHEGDRVQAGERLGSYNYLNLGVRYSLDGGMPVVGESSLYLRLKNALDERYEEIKGYPAPGRTVIAGMTITM